MQKLYIEFINTCPCCDEYGGIIKQVVERLGVAADLKIYYAGKDIEYVRKYGPVSKGTMIINGRKKYDTLTAASIEKAIADAAAEAGV